MIPVSLSSGVEPGARTGTSVAGQPVVIWRGQDGAVRAWLDRCPHRGMRLSFGFVRANALTCIYHGWSFGHPGKDQESDNQASHDQAGNAAGRCLTVPAHPGTAPPLKATVPALPATEALGLIWVGTVSGGTVSGATVPADTAARDAGLPPAAVGAGKPVYPVRSVTVRAPARALRAALEAALPPGTETAEAAGDSVIMFKGAAELVIAGVQDQGNGASSAHIVTTNPGIPERKALCQWAALVRDHLAAAVLP